MKIELGCGNNKREDFFGIDIQNGEKVDLVLDFEKEKLPFEDNSVEYVYSSHTFEHITNYPFVLKEILRVCKHGAIVEIWTPYGKSNDGFLFGHRTFITETHYKHICFEYDRFYLGKSNGYFEWEESHYNLFPDIINELTMKNISIDFALEHLFNIALEWGVFLRVRKDKEQAPSPQIPIKKFFYGRNNQIKIKR